MIVALSNTSHPPLLHQEKTFGSPSWDAPHVQDELGEFDVLCGRDKTAFNHAGNRRFRVAVAVHQDRYAASHSRKEKSVIIQSVVKMVHMNGGRFLRWMTSKKTTLRELSEKEAHEKVSHAFRDMVLSTKRTARPTHKRSKATTLPPPPTPTVVVTTNNTTLPARHDDDDFLASVAHIQAPIRFTVDPFDMEEFEPIPITTTPVPSFVHRAVDPLDIFADITMDEIAQALDSEDEESSVEQQQSVLEADEGDSIDDSMLSWLVGESNDILQNL